MENPDNYAVLSPQTKWIEIYPTSNPPHQSFLAPIRPVADVNPIHEPVVEWVLQLKYGVHDLGNNQLSTDISQFDPDVHLIGHKPGEIVLDLGNQQYLISYAEDAIINPPLIQRGMRRLSILHCLTDWVKFYLLKESRNSFLLKPKKNRNNL